MLPRGRGRGRSSAVLSAVVAVAACSFHGHRVPRRPHAPIMSSAASLAGTVDVRVRLKLRDDFTNFDAHGPASKAIYTNIYRRCKGVSAGQGARYNRNYDFAATFVFDGNGHYLAKSNRVLFGVPRLRVLNG